MPYLNPKVRQTKMKRILRRKEESEAREFHSRNRSQKHLPAWVMAFMALSLKLRFLRIQVEDHPQCSPEEDRAEDRAMRETLQSVQC